jgi:hypothetical protein
MKPLQVLQSEYSVALDTNNISCTWHLPSHVSLATIRVAPKVICDICVKFTETKI